MKTEDLTTEQQLALQKENYSINNLDDEIHVDHLCSVLLRQFHRFLLEERQLEPLDAGALASGADYFLRDYLIGHQRANIFAVTDMAIRRFAGHWYIISTLEPNLAELRNLLGGTEAFYHYCAEKLLIDAKLAESLGKACNDWDFYQERIETFHAITGDGFIPWVNDCPLSD